MELEGKIALVTGAGGGAQGRAIALALAAEGADVAATVNAICPGMVIGGRGEYAPSPEQIQNMKDRALLKDIIRPEDTANAVLFLASDKARMITGTTLDAYAVVPGDTDYWESFVKRRKDGLAKRKQTQYNKQPNI
jgi:NAD(P)-dependent dehydrogenase (short-subunit alcohol dehydrogenase family)